MRPPVHHQSTDWSDSDNTQLFQALQDAPDGTVKAASSGATDYTRVILRESSIVPGIQPVQTITIDKLTRLTSSTGGESPEVGVVECEREPGGPASRTVPFSAGPEQTTYRGELYYIHISTDETPELYKNVDQLGMYKMDLRQVITDNLLKDLDNLVDFRYFQTVKDITGSDPDTDGAGGYRQYREVLGGINRQNYIETVRPLQDATLNNGVFVTSRQTAIDFLGWGRDEMGGDLAERTMREGLNALSEFTLLGVPHIASIKATLLPKGHVFHFAPPNFLGRYYEFQAPTVYVKKERDIIYVYAKRKYGYGIGNEAAVARTVFPD